MSEVNNTPAENAAAPAPAAAPAAAGKSSTPMMMGILILLILLIAGGAAAFFLMNKDDKDSDDNDTEQSDEDEDSDDEEEDEDEDDDSSSLFDNDDEDEDEDEDSNSNNSNVCELLSEGEAEAILGESVSVTEETSTDCTFSTDGIAYIYFSVNEDDTSATAKQQYEYAKLFYGDAEEVDVDGADEAVWSEGLFQLSVLKDDNWIIVSSLSDELLADRDSSIAAAEVIVDNL